MNFIYIVGIIILIGEAECFIEDTTSIKISKEQRTLLRKLQNFQDPKDEAKPLTWNEMLADVLVNKIKIFSFNKVDDNDVINEYSEPPKSSSALINCFSQMLLIYKNCIYDKWRKNYEEPDFGPTSPPEPDLVIRTNTGVSSGDDPKHDIEIIEPKYHGKLQDTDSREGGEKKDCPEGAVKDDKGNCVKEISRLLISVPGQCPAGYRPDRLGNCRMVFY